MTIVQTPISSYDSFSVQKDYLTVRFQNVKEFVVNEFVHGGHLLAVGSSAVALSTMILLGALIRWEFLLIAYLCPLCIYSYDHYRDFERDAENNSSRTSHLRKYHHVHPLLIGVYGGLFIALLVLFGNLWSILFGISLLCIGMFYTTKVKQATTRITGFKNVYTSLSVASLILFTGIYCSYSVGLVLLLLFVFMFLRFMVNTCFCDIKDIKTDSKYHIRTLPVVLGKEKFLRILHVINLISIVPVVIGVYLQVLPVFSVLLIAAVVYSVYYIEKAKHQGTDMQTLSSVVVDGEFAFWPFIVSIGSSLPMVL
ncbi:MAG: UbiA family prenyltransferase [Candidatus Thermoplasmatota archaeon]|nr:UbiA family prenyltransferase [Candidatus Thermoplasmatota archaeon]